MPIQEPLQEEILKEFGDRLAASEGFSGIDLARFIAILAADVRPKPEEIIALLRAPAAATDQSDDDSH